MHASVHKIKPSLDLLGMDLAFDENQQILNWTKEEGRKKDIIEVYKSLKEHIELSIREIKKDFKFDL